MLTLQFAKHFYILFILLKTFRNSTYYYNPLCTWDPKKLSDFSKVSWSRDTGNEIKTKVTYLPSPVFLAHGGFPLRLPLEFTICSDSDLIQLVWVSVMSEHFQNVWESNENHGSSSQKKGYMYAHTKNCKYIRRESKRLETINTPRVQWPKDRI